MPRNYSFTAVVCVGLIFTLILSVGAFAKGNAPPENTRPKIVLDSIAESPDPFSPSVSPLAISAGYRILPTDSLVGTANGKTNKTFYVRQKIEILDASGALIQTLEQNFPIDPTGIKNASEYIQISTSAAWDGKNKQGTLAIDGSYTYKVSGIYLRVHEKGRGELQEKEIASSATLQKQVLLDATPPLIAVKTRTPAPNKWGWNNGAVTVTYEVSDATSGINEEAGGYEPDTVEAEGADQQVEGSVTDLAGNTASIVVDEINIDLTNPTITAQASGTQGENNWWVSEVTVSYTVADALSGIDPELGDHTEDVLGESADQNAEGNVYDKAGNHAETQIADIDVDLTPPTITAEVTPEANVAGWNSANPTITFSAEDQEGLSGVAAVSSPVTVTTEGAGQEVIGIATDNAGNSSQLTASVSLDKTAPVLSATLYPQPNAAGWNNSDVTVTFNATDQEGLSGLASVTDPQTVTAEGENQLVSGTATDNADNATQLTVFVSLDKTPPAQIALESIAFEPPDSAQIENEIIVTTENMLTFRAPIEDDVVQAIAFTDDPSLTVTAVIESVRVDIVGLYPGDHVVTVRLIDRAGNMSETQFNIRTEAAGPIDTDGDGIPDVVESAAGLDPYDPTDATEDKDNDGIDNFNEYIGGTDINNPDTDEDGILDGMEVALEMDPLNPQDADADPDQDGWSNWYEAVIFGTNIFDSGSTVNEVGFSLYASGWGGGHQWWNCWSPGGGQYRGYSASLPTYVKPTNAWGEIMEEMNVDATNLSVTGLTGGEEDKEYLFSLVWETKFPGLEGKTSGNVVTYLRGKYKNGKVTSKNERPRFLAHSQRGYSNLAALLYAVRNSCQPQVVK
ncbi:MAG: hypothetical protein KZQ81_17290 [Candidatus Thiodiazotropha sp. (ex Rostrolucina anterorostrata)]|nr:hypothetical protein [Candidatus Thiodiazotropha sp. (ex Rostrolucina anterorostrata)]